MEQKSSQLSAIVLAAGPGKRRGSSLAKVLHPLGGQPLIQHVVTSARKIGVNPIVLVVGHQADAVQEVFGKDEKDLFFAVQAEQLGTGHATSVGASAMPETSGDVLVLCGDVPLLRPETLRDLVDLHRQEGAAVTILTAIMEDASGYGRMLRAEGPKGRVVGIKEDADATPEERRIREINTGTYVFDLEFLFRALPQIRSENEQKEFYLTDVVSLAVAEGLVVAAMPASVPEEAMGVNNPEDLARAEALWADR
jgi:bifunctional UDP-N-acetylglucosamine pyrophosphorylase/glucosamine-1-phosphate N-acetyltransferase